MNPVLARLQSRYAAFQVPQTALLAIATADATLFPPEFYRSIVPEHRHLNLEYQVLRQQLVLHLKQMGDLAQLKEHLEAAILMAYLLEQLYKNYLDVPREVAQLRLDQALYQEILNTFESGVAPAAQPVTRAPQGLTPSVREATLYTNWYRLILARNKRLLDVLADLLPSAKSYNQTMATINVFANPIFAHLVWICYVPRFLTNIVALIKHTVYYSGMSAEEASLGWKTRLEVQLDRRGLDLLNDSITITVGLINACVLIGALAPVAFYLTLAAMAFDVVMAALNMHRRLSQLQSLREEYMRLPKNAALAGHLEQLDKQIHVQKTALTILLLNNCIVLAATCCAISFLGFCPYIALVGAILLAAVSIANYLAHYYVDSLQPDTNVEKAFRSSEIGFFAKGSEGKSSPDDTLAPVQDLSFFPDDSDLAISYH